MCQKKSYSIVVFSNIISEADANAIRYPKVIGLNTFFDRFLKT